MNQSIFFAIRMTYALLTTLAALLLLASSATASSCTNEALRAELSSSPLPDCRAYELIGPAAKNGWAVAVSNISLEGSRVLVNSLGGFSSSTQNVLFSVYSIERTPAGWITTPLVEPAGLFNPVSNNLIAANADLTRGLSEYYSLSTSDVRERIIYDRSLPDGQAVEIGPVYSSMVLASNPADIPPTFTELSASQNLKRVVFAVDGPHTLAGPLVNYLWPGDTTVENTGGQPFVSLYEYVGTGSSAPTRVGVDDSNHLISQCGTSLGFPSEGVFTRSQGQELYNAISADGSHLFFTAAAECSQGTGPPVNELFARINREKTVPISQPVYPLGQGSGSGPEECDATCEAATPGEGVFQGASEDGSKVFFLTAQPLLNGDEDTEVDVYGADLEGNGVNTRVGKIVQVSHNATAGQAAQVEGVARISEDGSHVYFVAKGVLTSTPNPSGAAAQGGADNFYVYERDTRYPDGHTAFIGTLSPADAEDWRPEDARPVDATSDGRFLVFTSRADLTPDDTSSVAQVFEYDAQAETLVRVSIGRNGFNDNGNTNEYAARIAFPKYRANLNSAPQPTSVSDNGAYVVFQSRNNLTEQAAPGFGNVYEYHAGQVSLLSDGQDRTGNTSLVGMDPAGTDVFFTTADRLVPQDGDTQKDVYDARINGGFLPPPPVGCEGDGCQGSLSLAPSFATVSSASQPTGEQVVEPPPKPAAKTKAKRSTKKAKRRKSARRARHRAHRSVRKGRHR